MSEVDSVFFGDSRERIPPAKTEKGKKDWYEKTAGDSGYAPYPSNGGRETTGKIIVRGTKALEPSSRRK